jgi:O-antigen/teichoic acid export membrane protein
MAFRINFALVGVLSLPLIVFGGRILSAWLRPAFGQQPLLMFPIIACSFALLGMNVTAHYALLAMGHVRVITYLNLLAGIVMLLVMALLVPRYGLQGAAWARLVYGPITCLAYFHLYRMTWCAENDTPLQQSPIYGVAATGTD